MSWAKLDDRFHQNRKIRRVWRRCPAALGLHVMAITYCAANLTDGVVDLEFVEDQLVKDRDRVEATDALVEAGLWHQHTDGWEINDYSEFNETRAEAEAKRLSKSEAGKAGAAARWGAKQSDSGSHASQLPTVMAPANGIALADDAPVPSRPDPTQPDQETSAQERAGAAASLDDARRKLKDDQVRQVFDAWVTATDRDLQRTKLTDDRRRRIERALKSHGLDDCLLAVRNIGASQDARTGYGRGQRYDDIEHALGSTERIERWRDATPAAATAAAAGAPKLTNSRDTSRFKGL